MTAPTYLSTYDAWGNFTSSLDTIQSFPTSEQLAAEGTGFRYRGYYYDTEIGLYYLNARYYDSTIHRFVNRDDISYLGATGNFNSYNLYAYCSNNPVMYVDPSGNSLILFTLYLIKTFTDKKDVELYDTMDEAILAWGEENYKLTQQDHKERGAIIFSKTVKGKKYYYFGKTRTGTNVTCWYAFVLGYLEQKGKTEGFIHTHTAYENEDGTWDPKDLGPSDMDMFLFKLPGIKRQFIANEQGFTYEFCQSGAKRYLCEEGCFIL